MAAGLALALPAARAESVTALAQKGNRYYKQERLDDAIGTYRDAIARDPQSPLIQYNLGTALARDQRYDEASQVLEQAARATSALSADASFNLGVARAESILKANPPVRQFLQESPSTDSPVPPKAVASIDPKGVQQTIDKLGEALQSFRQAVVKNPADSETKYNYEVTRQMIDRLGQLQEAQRKRQEAFQKQNPQQNNPQKNNQQQKDGQQNQGQGQDQGRQNQDPSKDKSQPADKSQDQQQGNPKPDDKQQDAKGDPKDSQGQHGLEKGPQATPTPAPTPSPSPAENPGAKGNPKGDAQDKSQGQPPKDASAAQAGSADKQPMTGDQMDSLRLLQLLEGETPEQFKKLFQFRGKSGNHTGKDW